jgi:hypothetical protein
VQLVRAFLSEHHLPALVIFSELWRSNPGRFFSNFMPYFNRALLVLPMEGTPTLLCGLSPRVYPWIRSVTTIEDVKPAGNFVHPLMQLAAERHWERIGFLDFGQFPNDIYRALRSEPLTMVPVASDHVYSAGADATELTMRRKTASLARGILDEGLQKRVGQTDHYFVGHLEQRLRHAGAEDVIVLLTNGQTPPSPPTGAKLEENFSVSLAMEYRGHWIRLSRPCSSPEVSTFCREGFERVSLSGSTPSLLLENLEGSYPYECIDVTDLRAGSIVAAHTESTHAGKRLFYGDTCIYNPPGLKPL